MTPKAPLAIAILLGCTALCSSAHAGWFDFGSTPATPDSKSATQASKSASTQSTQPANLDESIHQAQALRLAAKYPEAIKYLSQVMLVASDDPRVVSEYGKTLAAMGRASEAVDFLSRAQQLQSEDWTIYSALGVAYDELGNQKDAQINYQHALALKPGEPSVLSNYALSRLLAKDLDNASKLAAEAETANATLKDEEITRNIAMIRSVAPKPDAGVAVNVPAEAPVPQPMASVPRAQKVLATANEPADAAPMVSNAPPHPLAPANNNPADGGIAQSQLPRAQKALATANEPADAAPMVSNAPPRPLAPANNNPTGGGIAQSQLPQAQSTNVVPRGVVMQAVPIDPLAGPVRPVAANHQPRSKAAPKTDDAEKSVAKAEPAKTPAVATPVSAKTIQPQDALETKTKAIAKPLTNKSPTIVAAKAQANKPVQTAAKVSIPVKAQDVKPTPGTPKALSPTPVNTADAKTQPTPIKATDAKAMPAPVKAADAKTQKPSDKPNDTIPGLRLTANSY